MYVFPIGIPIHNNITSFLGGIKFPMQVPAVLIYGSAVSNSITLLYMMAYCCIRMYRKPWSITTRHEA